MTTKRTPDTPTAEAERKQRLAEALRENLRRRKAQARGRRDGDAGDGEPKSPRGG